MNAAPPSPAGPPAGVFAAARLAPGPVLVALLLGVGLAIVCNFWLFRSELLLSLLRACGGWLDGTLVANLLLLAVVVGGCLVAWGRARPADLGLRTADVMPAVLTTILLWLLLHAGLLLVALLAGEPVASSAVVAAPLRRTVAVLSGQLFGNALYEEILFRGCLLVQCARWATADGERPRRAAVWRALLLSQLLFALQHVPNRLAHAAWPELDAALADLALLWFSGLCFAGVYVRTGNLFVVVGLHTLGNFPALLLRGPEWVHPVVLFAATVALLVWGPRWFRRAAPVRPPQ